MPPVYAIPSANPELCTATFAQWKARGYTTAVLIDGDAQKPGNADLVFRVPVYEGYGASVNELCRHLDDADWIVTGGDDVSPACAAWLIAEECTAHFRGTFGVMQPGGPKHCCVSPWLGKEFRRRANRGAGPYWPEYFHFFDDTELKLVAEREGCFWRRNDIEQEHDHWSKRTGVRPAYLEKAAAGWKRASDLFESRRAAGFPGSEFLPCQPS